MNPQSTVFCQTVAASCTRLLYGAVLVMLILGSAANADETTKPDSSAYAQIFKTGTLSRYQPGDQMVYAQIQNHAGENAEESRLVFDFEDNDEMQMTQHQAGKKKVLGTFPTTVGNPINMYFLEKVIRAMAKTTGGSPFYIRNRLKDALRRSFPENQTCTDASGKTSEGRCVVLLPFSEDSKRDRMGDFADLRLSFAIDENDPAWLIGLHAVIPGKPKAFALHLDKTETQ